MLFNFEYFIHFGASYFHINFMKRGILMNKMLFQTRRERIISFIKLLNKDLDLSFTEKEIEEDNFTHMPKKNNVIPFKRVE